MIKILEGFLVMAQFFKYAAAEQPLQSSRLLACYFLNIFEGVANESSYNILLGFLPRWDTY